MIVTLKRGVENVIGLVSEQRWPPTTPRGPHEPGTANIRSHHANRWTYRLHHSAWQIRKRQPANTLALVPDRLGTARAGQMNTQTTCERCGKTVGCSEWDIHTCTPPAQPATEDSSTVQPTAQPAPVQSLPFGVGGGLVAIKTLLSRDPCAHATVAIQMIDAILAKHPPQKANTP